MDLPLNKIICGDCLDVMKDWPDNQIDTIICDPPYGLSFMGKKWDYDVPSIEIWRECLRVLKPGGTALIFAGSRTQHRMACNVEDAGFVLKDCILWLYGSGFPKATDISKQLDKGHKREVIGKKYEGFGCKRKNSQTYGDYEAPVDLSGLDITAPTTPEAILWNGWKSHGLKPAYEPILVAMKPNEGSYAENALKWGVSGLNIDGGRIPTSGENFKRPVNHTNIHEGYDRPWKHTEDGLAREAKSRLVSQTKAESLGRFPANIILDEEAGRLLDLQSGDRKSTPFKMKRKNDPDKNVQFMVSQEYNPDGGYSDSGGASRFFYCAKASKRERNAGCEGLKNNNPCYESHRPNYENTKGIETPYAGTGRSGNNLKNNHPTVKPLALMEYLCTLTKTPTGGTVLDCFAGSGSTLVACVKTGRDYIGIEKDPEYAEIARLRVKEQRAGQKGLWE